MTSVCVAMTVRGVDPSIVTLINYHRLLGVERTYLFFDDPNDPSIAYVEGLSGVKVYRCDAALRSSQQSLPCFTSFGDRYDTQVMARQMLNNGSAMSFAEAEGFDWLVACDGDELLDSGGTDVRRILAGIPKDTVQIIMPNDEAAPGTLICPNPFLDVTRFKVNPARLVPTEPPALRSQRRYFFLAYGNGKAAGRVGRGLIPLVHDFVGADGGRLPKFLTTAELRILHYVNCGFDRYKAKYQMLGDFADDWFGRPISIPFHLESRNALRDGGEEGLTNLYAAQALYDCPQELARLRRDGFIEDNDVVARVLGETPRVEVRYE